MAEAQPAPDELGGALPAWIGPSFLALAFAVFQGALGGDYVLDGVSIVRDNPLLASLDLGRIASADWWEGTGKPGGLYRPVALAWLGLLRLLGGGGPGLINCGNVALLGALAWLRCALLLRVLGPGARSLALAWLASALALVHPLGVELAAGQVGAADLLASSLAVAAVLVAWRGGARAAIGGAALAALATLSKENGVVVVPLAVLSQALRADSNGARGGRALFALGWSVAGVAIALACRYAAIGSIAAVDDPVFAGFPPGARAATACAVLAAYSVPLLFVPWRQMAVVGFQDVAPAQGFGDLRALAGLALLIALCVAPYFAWRRGQRVLAYGVWLFLAAWLPTSNLLVASGALAASRFLCPGLIGPSLVLASLIVHTWRRGSAWRIPAIALLCWFGAFFAYASARETGHWRNARSLLEAQIARAPSSIYAIVDLGTLLSSTEPERARELFAAAAALPLPSVPGSAHPPEDLLESVFVARVGSAQLARAQGDIAGAERELRAAEELTARALEAAKVLPYREDWSVHRAFVRQQLGALLPAGK